MRRVALTGGIATGKSWVLRRFASHAIPTIDADRIAHAVLAPGSPGARRVVERFGAAVTDADGGIDRRALGRLVFADAAARADLEAIVHPAVYDAIAEWFRSLPPGTSVAIADIPLLYETGHEHDFDEVVVTACAPEEQVRRLVARDGLPESEARARLSAQWPITEKMARASAVIDTSGTHEQTDAQVDALVARWAAGSPTPRAD
jgi:dephospho-CoA kinase